MKNKRQENPISSGSLQFIPQEENIMQNAININITVLFFINLEVVSIFNPSFVPDMADTTSYGWYHRIVSK